MKIKFRVYDKVEKKMLPPVTLLDIWLFQPQGLLNTESYLKDLMEDTMEIMQFTGLLDKKGVEIYSGYLIENKWGKVREVKWSDGKCGFMIGNGDFNFHTAKESKVVGNKWDNPELCKQ